MVLPCAQYTASVNPDRFLTHSLRGARLRRIMAAALNAVEPGSLVKKFLAENELPNRGQVFLLGIGKAAESMTLAAADCLGDYARALIITKHTSHPDLKRATVMEAGHPIPDERSLAAGRLALDFVSKLGPDDLLLCLISGGGSALVTAPVPGISLGQMQAITTSLLAGGADIDEVNVVRRALDRIKGGGLARATKAQVVSLILSDVIGDRLETIASGPTAANPTRLADAVSIAKKYRVSLPEPDSFPPGETNRIQNIQNRIIGNNQTAVQAALGQAQAEGFYTADTRVRIRGEAREVGALLATELQERLQTGPRPSCLIGGGETTVTVRGDGRGGRNQELALAAVDGLAGAKNALLISLATDGEDGSTAAAGAVVDGETRRRAQKLGMSAAEHLSRNDSYHFFGPLKDLLKPGYTGTNVNDLVFLVRL